MLLCEDARPSKGNPRKVDVFGLLSTINVDKDAADFPVGCSLCVYVALTEGRGRGAAQLAIRDAEAGEICYAGLVHRITFGSDPLRAYSYLFRITECRFPGLGLYWVEFRFNDVILSREPLLVQLRWPHGTPESSP
jgi:hypothetical protein